MMLMVLISLICFLKLLTFPYPELQNVSLAPITEDQLNVYHHNGSYNNNKKNVLGFLPQNMCYKTDTDYVHGEFYAVNPIDFELW